MKENLFFFLLNIALITTVQPNLLVKPNNENVRNLQINMDIRHNPVEAQYEHQTKFKKQQQEKLQKWVAQQLKANQRTPQIQPQESAIFILRSYVTQQYRLQTSLSNIKRVQVTVFDFNSKGQYSIAQQPTQQQYVEVLSSNSPKGLFQTQDKVYISKIIELEMMENHIFLNFINNGPKNVLVVLDIQEEQSLMEIVLNDDQFTLTEKKMENLLLQTKSTQVNRGHIYKWETGFYEMHARIQYDMLCLTAAELFIIFVTSAVQMYCIKNLIDDELII